MLQVLIVFEEGSDSHTGDTGPQWMIRTEQTGSVLEGLVRWHHSYFVYIEHWMLLGY